MKEKDPAIDQLREKLQPILERYQIDQAILFGSLGRGEATRHSDLDLILIQETKKRFFDRYEGIFLEISTAVKDRNVDLLIYTPQELVAISHRPFIALTTLPIATI